MTEENPKFEIRNPKQIQMTETLPPVGRSVLNFGILVIRACFGFRISDFVFPAQQPGGIV